MKASGYREARLAVKLVFSMSYVEYGEYTGLRQQASPFACAIIVFRDLLGQGGGQNTKFS